MDKEGHMRVDDVMTRTVFTVGPTATIEQAAKLMVERRVSGLPVVDEAGALLGIVSEGDLIARQRPAERLTWWRMFVDDEGLARDYRKRIGTVVADIMTESVISVGPEVDVSVAAHLLHTRNIRRLPVVSAGKLVGIVSRGDFVKLLAAPRAASPRHTGKALADELRRRLNEQPWMTDRGLAVSAEGGVVELWGIADSAAERAAIEATARSIEGCSGVKSHLMVTAGLVRHYGA
jgi:CBS domain-containing protein